MPGRAGGERRLGENPIGVTAAAAAAAAADFLVIVFGGDVIGAKFQIDVEFGRRKMFFSRRRYAVEMETEKRTL